MAVKENQSIALVSSVTNPFDQNIETYIWSFDQNETNKQITENDSILHLEWAFLHDNFDTSLGSDISICLDWIDVAGNSSDDTFDFGAISVITIVPESASFAFILSLIAGFYCIFRRKKIKC